ncbi:hypothetical protein SAMN02745163_03207 [Clostridium cavendishii DSM 21758]|uniref:Short-chain dehydrogenase n=1 Tax=Clostridium cavendishii DSM 21758 TaxID=1121302 RepID=A0A1M6PN16_9CLOT|nr:SDR family oxidoreductase [Clostridium cavendishii]SHK09344.1 hypothetical protein SAMN02745163_03207 [Clostridium cavendishii DSM 21758]
MNKTVLITGATSGIGFEFAKLFAKNGFNLIITGRNSDILSEMKAKLSSAYNIKVFSFNYDLSDLNSVTKLYDETKKLNLKIDILINNAGAGFNGGFLDVPLENHISTINLNITALTKLTYLIANDMKLCNSGKILNVASTGAYQPGPYIGVYYATKSYVLSLTQALRQELKDTNITVSALCPGATKTKFAKRAGKNDLSSAMSPYEVALIGYNGLAKNKAIITPGFMNKIAIFFSKLIPLTLSARLVMKIQLSVIKKKNEY